MWADPPWPRGPARVTRSHPCLRFSSARGAGVRASQRVFGSSRGAGSQSADVEPGPAWARPGVGDATATVFVNRPGGLHSDERAQALRQLEARGRKTLRCRNLGQKSAPSHSGSPPGGGLSISGQSPSVLPFFLPSFSSFAAFINSLFFSCEIMRCSGEGGWVVRRMLAGNC